MSGPMREIVGALCTRGLARDKTTRAAAGRRVRFDPFTSRRRRPMAAHDGVDAVLWWRTGSPERAYSTLNEAGRCSGARNSPDVIEPWLVPDSWGRRSCGLRRSGGVDLRG